MHHGINAIGIDNQVLNTVSHIYISQVFSKRKSFDFSQNADSLFAPDELDIASTIKGLIR